MSCWVDSLKSLSSSGQGAYVARVLSLCLRVLDKLMVRVGLLLITVDALLVNGCGSC